MTILALLFAFATIDRIDVEIHVGVLGPSERYAQSFQRRGHEREFDALAAAIADRRESFDLRRSLIDRAFLERTESYYERSMYGANPKPERARAFRARYENYDELASLCATQMNVPLMMSDYYPSLKMTLRMKDGALATITGRSQREFFVPLTIADDSGERTTFDPAITARIAALLPPATPLRLTMLGNDVAAIWAFRAAGQEWPEPACRTIGRPFLPYTPADPTPIPGM